MHNKQGKYLKIWRIGCWVSLNEKDLCIIFLQIWIYSALWFAFKHISEKTSILVLHIYLKYIYFFPHALNWQLALTSLCKTVVVKSLFVLWWTRACMLQAGEIWPSGSQPPHCDCEPVQSAGKKELNPLRNADQMKSDHKSLWWLFILFEYKFTKLVLSL